MSLEPGVALHTVDIAIEACQEVQGEPQIDDGRGCGPFGRPAFLRGMGSLRRGVGAPVWAVRGRLEGVAMPSSSCAIEGIFPTSRIPYALFL
jgi:hypothetical protein